MEKDIAIKVENVSKTFRIPHEKVSSLRGAFVNVFREKTYEEFKALDSVSFEVKKGEFFGIIGRNGSGKSTLLKILAGIYQPDRGKVSIHGMISPFLELGIGFNPELSGRDNVYLNATVLGLTKKQIDEKFDSIVAFSELERFIDQKLKNYSSGMQVRLAFSVSVHANRDILLMDEVLAVGDSNFQSKCLTEFSKYREIGRTVVLVTHDIGVVQKYCDRAMLLRNGKIEMIGDPQEVGAEYIDQNMSDEERRLLTEEKRQKVHEKEEQERLKRQGEDRLKKMQKDDREAEVKRMKEEDEKKRLQDERKVAKIKKVEFMDKEGKVRNTFQTGDDLTARVCCDFRDKDSRFNFGIALFNQEHIYILGINTFIDKIETSKYVKNGYFEVSYGAISLGRGGYYVKAGIWGETSENLVDFLNKSDVFTVFQKNRNEGVVQIPYSWR